MKEVRLINRKEFSSPLGVIYISMEMISSFLRKGGMFSSPLGVIYISIGPKWEDRPTGLKFSSPLGVIYISIRKDKRKTPLDKSFRPLSGSSISQ